MPLPYSHLLTSLLGTNHHRNIGQVLPNLRKRHFPGRNRWPILRRWCLTVGPSGCHEALAMRRGIDPVRHAGITVCQYDSKNTIGIYHHLVTIEATYLIGVFNRLPPQVANLKPDIVGFQLNVVFNN